MPEQRKQAKSAGAVPGTVVIDFSQVKPFEPLDSTRKYLVSVLADKLGKSKEGKPKTSVTFSVVKPEEVQVEEWVEDSTVPGGYRKGKGLKVDDKGNQVITKAKNRQFFREYSLEPQALPFLYEYLKALDPDAKLDEDFEYDPKEHMGLQVVVSITNEAYDEQVRPRVKKIYPASIWKE